MQPHPDQVIQHAQVEEKQQGRVLRKADPGFLRKKAAGMGNAEQRIQRQETDVHEEHDAGHIQHDSAADADPAAPDEPGPGAEVFKHLHERIVLPAFNKAVVGNTVNMKLKMVLPAECLHFFHEAEHMGRNSVHIQRQAENSRIRAAELVQNAFMVRRRPQLFGHLLPSREQPLQGEEIRGSAEALLGAAIDEHCFHSTASSSAGSERKMTSDR